MSPSRPTRLPALSPIIAWPYGLILFETSRSRSPAHSARRSTRRICRPASDQFVKIAAADLAARRGAALVLAGPRQSADVHALCHWINEQLHAPIDFIAPVDPVAAGHSESLRTLTEELRTGHIDTLMIVGCNPAYDTPGELALAQHHCDGALLRPSRSLPRRDRRPLHLASAAIPCAGKLVRHARRDGTASIVQPLIRPLYDTRTRA